MEQPPSPLPPNFLWGAATSSYQVEGGNTGCDWSEWEQVAGRIAGGGRSGKAAEWWAGRAEEDLAVAAASGQNAHRLSLEWSRLEPEPGRWDDAAFQRYGRLLRRMRELGLEPLVTLYHFTLPRWAAAGGGWEDDGLPERLARLATECGRRLGGVVRLWVTLNEPFSLIYHGYLCGRWAPGTRPLPRIMRAARNLQRAQAASYHALHASGDGLQVGISHLMQHFVPARAGSRLDRLAAFVQQYASVVSWLEPLRTGRLCLPWSLSREAVPGLRGSADFLGVNYYGTFRVRFNPGSLTLGRYEDAGNIRRGGVDWGAPEPEGLLDGLRRGAALELPVYVTENGICDPTDTLRQKLLTESARTLARARREGVDVRGYFHWSLVDNFEWSEGWEAPFGLIALDPSTQVRCPRPSLALYGEIARSNGARALDNQA